MNSESLSAIDPFILSWNLRNTIENPSSLNSGQLTVVGSGLGEFPIHAWKTYFLEIPENGHKMDIAGRTNSVFGIGMRNQTWDRKRVIVLPVYTRSSSSEQSELKRLKMLIKHWNDACIPDDIPCMTIAVKCKGHYSEGREAQAIAVLLVWSDAVARMITLDWIEGPLEDCMTPEWYIEATPLLKLSEALEMMGEAYRNLTWGEASFSIYAIPSCLGHGLRGERKPTTYRLWDSEWRYADYVGMRDDLTSLLFALKEMFFNDGCESHEQ